MTKFTQNPKDFIRIIAAFTILRAHQLGYDPSMQLFDATNGNFKPSYKLGKAIYAESHRDMQWQITMNNGDKYVTVKALTLSRAGFMHGSRSTIAWAVLPAPRMDSKDSKGNKAQVIDLFSVQFAPLNASCRSLSDLLQPLPIKRRQERTMNPRCLICSTRSNISDLWYRCLF